LALLRTTTIIAERDETIQQADDLRRSVDYLESRSDLNHEKLGFFAHQPCRPVLSHFGRARTSLQSHRHWSVGATPSRLVPEADP